MSSNGEWGDLAEFSDAFAEVSDSFTPLPDEGNVALDALCKRKNLTVSSLVRVGARLANETTLAFLYDQGIKYRSLIDDRRWSHFGSEFPNLKLVQRNTDRSTHVIVCEGETDGARLTELYPEVDVAIMPAGARRWTARYAEQLQQYELVLVALDNDEAGNVGADKVIATLPQAMRFPPPSSVNDWCELDGDPPELPTQVERDEPQIIVPAGAMLELPEPDIVSWFSDALLPVGGFMMIHGWAKSFKSFLGLDIVSALAQCQPWATFEPTEEPTRTLVVQYEIPWAFYRQRVLRLQSNAVDREAFDQNFNTWTPLARPTIKAGDTKAEDFFLRSVVDSGIQVVLFDPIRRAAGNIDMNDEKEARKMLSFFERINAEGITVIAVHHDNKTSAKGGGGDPIGMTGTGAWVGDPDTIVSVELPKGEDHGSSLKRNINFTLRNAPMIGSQSFVMTENGIEYHQGEWDSDEDPTAPTI